MTDYCTAEKTADIWNVLLKMSLQNFPGEAPGKIKACFRAKTKTGKAINGIRIKAIPEYFPKKINKIRKVINESYTELKTWHLRKQEIKI